MRNNKGFTLVEILAVITILGIIIIFALPVALDTIGKSRNQLNEYTRKNIADTAKMYFMDIVEKVDPDNKYYTVKDDVVFTSNITGKEYKNGDSIFGYDFLLYALLKSNPNMDSEYITSLESNAEQFKYAGSTFFEFASGSVKKNDLTVSLYDLVEGEYYNKECRYKGMNIKTIKDGKEVIEPASKDTNCTISSTCRVNLKLETKINPKSGLFEVVNYDIQFPENDEYTVSEAELKHMMGLKDNETIPSDKQKNKDGTYTIKNDCRIIS